MKQYRLLSDTNKLITMNYQQSLLYSESNNLQKINDSVGCSVSSHHGIPLSVIQENVLIDKSIKT